MAQAGQIEPSTRLLGKILSHIEDTKIRKARMHLFFTGLASLASFAAIFPALNYFTEEFSQSGFYGYLSLIFSDGGILIASWKEFSLALAESMPVLGTIAILSVVLVLLVSVQLALKNMKTAFLSIQFN